MLLIFQLPKFSVIWSIYRQTLLYLWTEEYMYVIQAKSPTNNFKQITTYLGNHEYNTP